MDEDKKRELALTKERLKTAQSQLDDDIVQGLMELGVEVQLEHSRENTKQRQEDARNPLKSAQYIDGIMIEKVARVHIATVPIPQGKVVIKYSEIARSRQSFETIISVQLFHHTDGTMPEFQQRLDLNSASGVSTFVTALNGAYGGKKEGYNWTLILNRANNVLRQMVLEEKKVINVTEMVHSPATFLLYPFLQKGVSNMVFGNSEVGKTYFCLYMAACAASSRSFLGYDAKPFKTLYLDFEDSVQSFTNRLHELSKGLGVSFHLIAESIQYYNPEASIKEESEIVAKMVEEGGYDLIVIDAGADASGGSPNDESRVLEMFNSLNNIPCTKLIIHHEPKNVIGVSPENAYYGTAFWRARIRVGWRLTVEQNEGDKKVIKATMTKSSNLAPVLPFNYSMQWGGADTPCIAFDLENDFKASDETRIIHFLMEGESGTDTIADAVGMTRTTAQRKLSEMLEKDLIERRRDDNHVRRILWSMGRKEQKNEDF